MQIVRSIIELSPRAEGVGLESQDGLSLGVRHVLLWVKSQTGENWC
jgi:hypothetical protein